MGIPKFFRFMSERYPLISNLIVENKIPEFDNLYLDMNGIIHNCSHPNDEDAHFRITEDQIFVAIFSYIEHLFAKIKPKKLFFMAIDGVAPRAKMNQQRSRRFRTAKEAKEIRDKALRKGEELPKEAAFDSNAITPGTPFMARLSEQLKWFINKKVTEDADWQGVEVVLSGHEVPGEGEHKIMEYIRHAKAQPDYNPNVRHCLYGLDADLIMLGLLSHDPHFCLLREEVVFGPARKKKSAGNLEATNFFLLHLSLFREYLDMEFQSIELHGFEYDLERIIDDFILLAMLIGNDFLPHLPGLHIHEGALPLLFGIYKQMLPTAGGYINEHGILHLERFQTILDGLASLENDQFEEEYAEANWFKGKQKKHIDAMEKARAKAKLALTTQQRALYEQVKAFVRQNTPRPAPGAALTLPATLPARDRRFLQTLATDLQLACDFDEIDETEEPLIVLTFGADVAVDSEDDHEGAEARVAVDRVLKKYDKAPTHSDPSEIDVEEEYARKLDESHKQWKREYYREKLEFSFDDPAKMHDLVYRYIEGLQWVLHYYYDGVVSWGWFYDYHYAPKISDLKGIAAFQFDYQLGAPFKPYEQLMGVLPDLSNAIIPSAFRDLMSDPASPIIDFYPREFVQDLNGKKQDWEAIVKIPFIDEHRLLKTMATREHRLTPEERARNGHGTSWHFTLGPPESAHVYPSSQAGFFPDLLACCTQMEPFALPTMDGLHLVKGLCDGVLLGKDAIAGFPSLHTLPHSGQLSYHSVKVFNQESKGETMVVHLENPYDGVRSADLAATLIGHPIYVNWPYLQAGQVAAVSDELFRYEAGGGQVPHRPDVVANWRKVTERIDFEHSKRYGVVIGDIDLVVHVRLLKGLKRTEEGAFVKDYEDREVDHAVQTTVIHVSSQDERYLEREARPIEEEYPEDSNVFFLGGVSYGAPARVLGHEWGLAALRYVTSPADKQEQFLYRQLITSRPAVPYHPSHVVSRKGKMSALTLSKITSALMIQVGNGDGKINVGLNLKFEAKAQKVLGYTRKHDSGWEYSDKAIELIREYKAAFPEIIAALDARSGDTTRSEDFFPNAGDNLDKRIDELKKWIAQKGTRDFDKVALHAEQLEKEAVLAIEAYADQAQATRKPESMQTLVVRNIPRRALLKPEHAEFRLQGQQFMLGDRVVQVQQSGNVPLCNKGVVVGVQAGLLDVVWDHAFIGGTTLGDRCSAYRGQTVAPNSVLNLTQPQYLASTAGRPGPTRAVRGQRGGLPRSNFAPAPNNGQPNKILHRNGGGGHHRGGVPSGNYGAAAQGRADQAYAPGVGLPSQQGVLQQTLNVGHARRQDYSAVPPPAVLTQPARGRGHHRGAPARGWPAPRAILARGGAPAAANGAPAPAAIPAPTPAAGRGRGRGRGRGMANGTQAAPQMTEVS